MDRRAFLVGAGGAAALFPAWTPVQAQTAGKRVGYYEFGFFRMTQGDRPARLAKATQAGLPLIEKYNFGPVGFFDMSIGPESPSLVRLVCWENLGQREEVSEKMGRDPEYLKLLADLESGPEPPYDRADTFLVRATAFSPPLAASASEQKPRLFELRVYHSPTYRQLIALEERFAGPEIKIFHRCGIHPILYGYTTVGPDMPNLVYLTPFESLAAREKAWAAFGADPEWQKVRGESIQKSGQIVSRSSITMLRATPWSPIR